MAANIVRLFTLGTCVGITACEQMTIGSSFLADRAVGHLGLIVDGAVYSGVEDALEKQPIRFNCFAL